MKFGGAALAGISQGIPQGIQDFANVSKQYDAGVDQASQVAFGRTLQMLQMQQNPPPPIPGTQGIPGVNGQQAQPQPPMGGGQPQGQMSMGGGGPPMPQAGPPMGAPPQGGMQPPQMQRPPQPQMQQPQQQGGGQFDWRQIMQAIVKANPGAPPQVIAGAVNHAIPVMNSQSQMEWKQMQMMMREQSLQIANERLQMQQTLGQERASQGQQRLNQGEERLDIQREAYGQAPRGGGQQFAQDFDKPGGMGGQQKPQQGAAASIADQIVSGKAPPVTTGMYRMSGPVRADLAQKHPDFNLAQAQLEWKKAEKMTQNLAGPQQLRFQQLGTSVVNTMDLAAQQAKELQLSGITPLNKAKLDALINLRGNSPIGQQAAKYVQTVAVLKGEIANLENGGYAPTESSWAQARNVINENYGVEEFLATIPNAQRLINYRLQAQQQIPQGMSQGDRYKVPQGTEAPAQSQGIPQGWSVKEH